ncbi:rhodanese-like domain-containing protein [Pseudonocardia sp. N23]|uniref:rhodanese-like domain-containing protein n=1 Tax=Pseudonocardia sp. N23 TaxID=1987376 RepID=UPI000C0336DE|nr:rhodanese-like domain-containing protein [Pseudonocardia sp. N23]GAY11786.1 metallo-beta-lactamase family protein [Pseudonocardia sp. N23]
MSRRRLSLVRSEVAGLPPMTPADAARAQGAGAFVLDVRDPVAFAVGHLPGSVNIAADDVARFAALRDALLPPGVEVVLAGPADAAARAAGSLTGHAPLVGHLVDPGAGSISRRGPVEGSERAGVRQIVDVRTGGADVDGAVRIPVEDVLGRLAELRPDVRTAVLDADGYVSSAVASLLRACGFGEVVELVDGAVPAAARPRLRLLASA